MRSLFFPKSDYKKSSHGKFLAVIITGTSIYDRLKMIRFISESSHESHRPIRLDKPRGRTWKISNFEKETLTSGFELIDLGSILTHLDPFGSIWIHPGLVCSA